jgi:hypothetical protein
VVLAALALGQDVRFRAVDVFVDPGEEAVAAWQVELPETAGRRIVGIEGGDGVWADPPYYDAAALKGGRIVLAAFRTGDVPKGRVRVARLHLQESGEAAPYAAKLVVAARPGGDRVPARVEIVPMGENR